MFELQPTCDCMFGTASPKPTHNLYSKLHSTNYTSRTSKCVLWIHSVCIEDVQCWPRVCVFGISLSTHLKCNSQVKPSLAPCKKIDGHKVEAPQFHQWPRFWHLFSPHMGQLCASTRAPICTSIRVENTTDWTKETKISTIYTVYSEGKGHATYKSQTRFVILNISIEIIHAFIHVILI